MEKLDPRQMKIFAAMPIERKWELVASLEREARALCASRLRQENPDWTPEEIEAGVRRWWLHSVN